MHSNIYGICILENLNEVLTDFTSLNEDSYEYEQLVQFSDYVRAIEIEKGRVEFESHLAHWFPNTDFQVINNIKIYSIALEDLEQILDRAYQQFKVEVAALEKNSFYSVMSTQRHSLVESLEGEYGGVKYGILDKESEAFYYPENLLQTVRYLYQEIIKSQKQEILVQFVGALDYHY